MMKKLRKIGTFVKDESGSLLVFFAVSTLTLLGILALSFDMGRRASTQTDMQGFADNVVIAAAGELDGQDDSIARAKAAAVELILAANEQLKEGTVLTSGSNLTIQFDPNDVNDMVFYSSLPARDTPSSFTVANLETHKYDLPATTTTTDPKKATYVGVKLNTVNVNWLFANALGSSNLPNAAVAAVSVAGNTAWTCDVAPLMFCVPQNEGTTGPAGPVFLDPGTSVLLRSGGSGQGFWGPGDFGFLRLSNVPVDPDGPCAGLNPNQTDACLINVKQNLNQCFQSRGVDMDPGQRNGSTAVIFNIPFDMYKDGNVNSFQSDPNYAPGPHTISGFKSTSGKYCDGKNLVASGNTMPFPPDDCLASGGSCTYENSKHQKYTSSRFGDTNWSNGSNTYFDVNYGTYTNPANPTPATVISGSGRGGDKGDGTKYPDFSFKGLNNYKPTRYQTYMMEIARAAAGNTSQMTTDFPSTDYDSTTVSMWQDAWKNFTTGLNGLRPILPNRTTDNGLPQCGNKDSAGDPERRVVVVAGIDCAANGIKGAATNVPVQQFYRAFMMQPVGVTGVNEDVWVEIIEPVGGTGGGATEDGVYHNVVQLYR